MRKLLKLSKWLLLSVAIAALFAEVYLRKFSMHIVPADGQSYVVKSDPGILVQHLPQGKRLVPNAKVYIRNHILTHKDVFVRVNSLGLRGPEVGSADLSSGQNVLMLGDSITLADHLQEEDTIVSMLAQHLKRAPPDSPVNVLNLGVGNTGTREQIDHLLEIIPKLKPRILVLAFYLNDSRPAQGFSGEIINRDWLRQHSLLAEKLYMRFALWRWLRRFGADQFTWVDALNSGSLDWKADPKDFQKLVELARYDWGAAWRQEAWEMTANDLDKIKTLSEQWKFDVVGLILPVSFQVYSHALDNLPQQKFEKLVQERGWKVVDPLPRLRESRERKLFVDHCHTTAAANELIAQSLIAPISSLL